MEGRCPTALVDEVAATRGAARQLRELRDTVQVMRHELARTKEQLRIQSALRAREAADRGAQELALRRLWEELGVMREALQAYEFEHGGPYAAMLQAIEAVDEIRLRHERNAERLERNVQREQARGHRLGSEARYWKGMYQQRDEELREAKAQIARLGMSAGPPTSPVRRRGRQKKQQQKSPKRLASIGVIAATPDGTDMGRVKAGRRAREAEQEDALRQWHDMYGDLYVNTFPNALPQGLREAAAAAQRAREVQAAGGVDEQAETLLRWQQMYGDRATPPTTTRMKKLKEEIKRQQPARYKRFKRREIGTAERREAEELLALRT